MATTKKGAERLIKKYPNRRLYDTQTSTYITLADVKQLVMDTEDFKVIDAKSGDELTRSILLQIILEEETGGVPMFSSSMLSQIIRYYGHAMQGMMGTYLEKNIQAFIDIQNKLAENSKGLYSGEPFSPDMWSHEYAGADDAGDDEQLHRAEQEPVRADAGADAEPGQEYVRHVPVQPAGQEVSRGGPQSSCRPPHGLRRHAGQARAIG
jgi:polyhydroxyalkanoate synthesis repressor PhaR